MIVFILNSINLLKSSIKLLFFLHKVTNPLKHNLQMYKCYMTFYAKVIVVRGHILLDIKHLGCLVAIYCQHLVRELIIPCWKKYLFKQIIFLYNFLNNNSDRYLKLNDHFQKYMIEEMWYLLIFFIIFLFTYTGLIHNTLLLSLCLLPKRHKNTLVHI